jgi:hypothetical protein
VSRDVGLDQVGVGVPFCFASPLASLAKSDGTVPSFTPLPKFSYI